VFANEFVFLQLKHYIDSHEIANAAINAKL